MSSIAYTAKRDIIAGHVKGTIYTFDIDFQDIQEEPQEVKKQHRSISGVTETWLQRRDTGFLLATTSINMHGTLHDVYREFIAATSAGEVFIFDEFGSVEFPSANLVSLFRGKESPQITRIPGIQAVTFSFKALKVI